MYRYRAHYYYTNKMCIKIILLLVSCHANHQIVHRFMKMNQDKHFYLQENWNHLHTGAVQGPQIRGRWGCHRGPYNG